MSDLELQKTGTEAEIREDDAVVARTVRKSSYCGEQGKGCNKGINVQST